MTVSSSERDVVFGSLGPVDKSAVETRFLHLATVLGLIHGAWPTLLGSLDYLVLFDELPLSLWRSREEPVS